MAAGDAVVIGSNAFTEQPTRRRYVKGRGWYRVRTFIGPNDSTLIDTLTASLTAANVEDIDVSAGHPTTVTALVPSDANQAGVGLDDPDLQTEWSLEPYDLNKSLSTHGKFNGSAVSASVLATIDAELAKGNGYNKDWEAQFGSIGELNDYAKLRGQSVDDYLQFGYVLRAVLSCEADNEYIVELQQSGLIPTFVPGRIVKWSDIGVPASAKIEQPAAHYYGGAEDPLGTGWHDVLVNEWMVKPMAIRFSRRGRVRTRQIVREFLGAVRWSSTLYDGGTGVP